MKLAVIAPSALPSRRANAIQTLQMVQAFARLGHSVLLAAYPSDPAALSLRSAEKGESAEPLSWQALAAEYGLEVAFEIKWLKAQPWARRYDYAVRAVGAAQRWGAELFFTRLPQAAAWASLLGMPTIFEAHDLPRRGAAYLVRLFLLGKGAKRVIAISHALAQDLSKTFPSLGSKPKNFLVVAPDGVDLRRYTPLLTPMEARASLRQSGWEIPDGFVAGYTGHLYRGRGAAMLVSLAAAFPEIHFLIVGGEAPQRQALEQQFKSLGLSNYTLTGLVAPPQVAQFQLACDVLLMPYQRQVAASSGGDIAPYLSPMKLFEYLASGRPILAADLAVFREILNAENAILLPPEEVGAWSSALQLLMANPARRHKLGEAARNTAQAYSWESRARLILGD